MQMLELVLAIFGFCSALALLFTWLIGRRNATICAAMPVFKERLDHIRRGAFTAEDSDCWSIGELAATAAAYASSAAMASPQLLQSRREQLVMSGALVLAALECLETADQEMLDTPDGPLASCIGCGCTDIAACTDRKTGRPCYWLVVDRSQGHGVCSNCDRFMLEWDRHFDHREIQS